MKIKELITLLKEVNVVSYNSWNDVMLVHKYIQDGKAEIISKDWYDSYKNKNKDLYPLDLTKRDTWSTFDGCVEIHFQYDDCVNCVAKIYNGDNIHGYRTTLKFTAVIKFDNSILKELEDKLLYELQKKGERLYEKFLEEQKVAWIDFYKKKVLYDAKYE